MTQPQLDKLYKLLIENVFPKTIFEMKRHGVHQIEVKGYEVSLYHLEKDIASPVHVNTFIRRYNGGCNDFVTWANNLMEYTIMLSNTNTDIERAIETASIIHLPITRTMLVEKISHE